MADEEPSRSRGRSLPSIRMPHRGPVVAALVAAGLLCVYLLVALWARVWTEQLWFASVGYSEVFRTEYLTRGLLFVAGAVIAGGVVRASMTAAFRSRPELFDSDMSADTMERYRVALEPFRRVSFVVAPALFGLFGGAIAQGQWRTALLWLHRQPFGRVDSYFHKDIGFYVFTLPWIQFLISFATMVLVLALVAGAVTHYIYGGIAVARVGHRFTRAARVHICLLAAGLALLRAAATWFGRYSMTSSQTSLFTGIDYTADHASLPMKAILASAAVVCAILFVATIRTGTWRLPLVGLASFVVCGIVLGGIYPALVQAFKVRPSMQQLQSSYIKENIEATRTAYGIADVKLVDPYTAVTTATPAELRRTADAVPGIRLVDPYLVSSTFQQMQGKVNYFRFGDVLDVDRYDINGKDVDTVIGVRELDTSKIPDSQRNWVNLHTVYTHGYGVVAAAGNQRSSDGEPVYLAKGLTDTSELGTYEPRIYFGETSPDYSIVGGAKNGKPAELDYPDSGGTGEKRSTYNGIGGVSLGSPLRRFAYAVKYQEYNFLFSDAINGDSRLLDVRTPQARVKKVAPWLTLDGDAYPVVTGGRVQWVLDGYTSSDMYPGSELSSLGSSTSDSVTRDANNVRALQDGQINYLRNSVKATVDAFDGTVRLYAWDDKDPVLKAWRSAFGGTVLPMSKMPAGVLSHVRYPEDLFKVQRDLLTRYHVTDPGAFFTGGSFWRVPADPTNDSGEAQPPYYLSVLMPGTSKADYSLTSTYIPFGAGQNLAAFMAVNSDAGSTPGKIAPTYGQFTILKMSSGGTVKGPGQFQSDVTSSTQSTTSPAFSSFTLKQFLSTNGTSVQSGNALTLPLAGGLLYVEPIYLRGSAGYPLQQAVVVEFGNELRWGATLQEALDQLFGPSATTTPDAGSDTKTPPRKGSGQPPAARPSGALAKAIADAQKAYDDGQAALAKQDWAAYGKAQEALKKALAAAAAAAQPKK